jgi:hypothetical protein
VQFWSVKTGTKTSKLPAQGLRLALSPDGQTLAVGGYRDDDDCFGTTGRTELLGIDGKGTSLSLSPAGSALAFSADGYFLAMGRGSERLIYPAHKEFFFPSYCHPVPLQFIETATGNSAFALPNAPTNVSAVAVSPDGTKLAAFTRSHQLTILDLTPPHWDAARAKKLTRKEAENLWQTLSGVDAEAAYEATWTLAASEHALALCGERLRTVKMDPARVKQLLADLESRRFSARDAALKELRALGTSIEPQLRRALEARPSLDARKKLEDLIAPLGRWALTGDQLLHHRAVMVLERVGTPAARDVLKTIADREGQSYLGSQARQALGRLAKR